VEIAAPIPKGEADRRYPRRVLVHIIGEPLRIDVIKALDHRPHIADRTVLAPLMFNQRQSLISREDGEAGAAIGRGRQGKDFSDKGNGAQTM